MFALLSRALRTPKASTSRFPRLFLERLEDRLSPGGITPPGPGPAPAPTETITMNVTYLPNQQATFSGQLTNQSGPIANQTVNLTGVVNATATTDAQGNYSITVAVPQLGQENAASADGLSNTAQSTLVSGAPDITSFTAVAQGGGVWRFSGSVSGAPTQGEVIDFGGINALQGKTINVNPDGTFSCYVTVSSGQGGWATAEAVDWWGDTSEIAGTGVNC